MDNIKIDSDKNTVRLLFSKPVTVVTFTPDEALALGDLICHTAIALLPPDKVDRLVEEVHAQLVRDAFSD